MAIKSKDELLSELKAKLGEDDSDDTLSFIEDISDTYDDMSDQLSKSGEWKTKYEQNDKEWRQKYRDRFFSKPIDEPDINIPTEPATESKKPMTYADLFKTE